MTADSKSLVAVLQESRLIEPADLQQVNGWQQRFPDAKGVGAHLIRAGMLTPFQVNQLLQGRSADLVLGPYHLLERIGEGGMGQVFKARHEKLQRIVALKLIRKEKLADPRALDRFQREARAAAQLSHPNIVLLYDASQAGGIHFLAMEYVEGRDLAQTVKDSGPLPVDRACDYIRQAALGLQHAHERGLVHRDIKPSNLLVTSVSGCQGAGHGVVKVLDMGLARLCARDGADAADPTITQAGTLMGTPDFMAPEQAKNSSKVDARADLYSLGCTLYFLLTGKPLFEGNGALEKLMHHQLDEPCPIRKLRPDVPEALAQLLGKLLAKRPEDRFPSAAALADALAPFCPGAQRGVIPGFRNARSLSPVLRRKRMLVAGLVACLLLGLGMFAFSGSAEKPRPGEASPSVTAPPTPSSERRPSQAETSRTPDPRPKFPWGDRGPRGTRPHKRPKMDNRPDARP
jgi:eukaryotic-like serine/threonine-protein kinase